MRLRFLIALLAAAALSLAPVSDVPGRYTLDQRIAGITWDAACRISKYDCDVQEPTVRRSPVLGENSARGAYWEDSTVLWLDNTLHGTQFWLTTFHEQIHYLQGHNTVGFVSFDAMLTCLVEREALEFVNTYADELGRPDLKRPVDVWRKIYNCRIKKSKIGMHH